MKKYKIVGLLPIEERTNYICGFCGNFQSVKYKLEAVLSEEDKKEAKKVGAEHVYTYCCNRCCARYSSFDAPKRGYQIVYD